MSIVLSRPPAFGNSERGQFDVGTSMPPKQTLPDWAMPLMFGTLISILAWIAVTLQSMSNTLAVAVTKVEDHDRRLSNLETLFMSGKGG